jgi:hypothetical protein
MKKQTRSERLLILSAMKYGDLHHMGFAFAAEAEAALFAAANAPRLSLT